MVGYLIAIAALGGASGALVTLASFVPFWSPFVMLARLMVGRVEPWELALSVALLRGGHRRSRCGSRSGSTAPACCSTGSARVCARSWRRREARGRRVGQGEPAGAALAHRLGLAAGRSRTEAVRLAISCAHQAGVSAVPPRIMLIRSRCER